LTGAIVERMAALDNDFSVGATLAEDGAGIWSSPKSTATAAPRDFKSLYEQQRARADTAEARCEALRQAEISARSGAGYWKWQFKSCRCRLSEAEEEAKALRNEARDVPSLRAQVARLEALLSKLGAQLSAAARFEALSKEGTRLQDALAAPPGRRGGAGRQLLSAGEARRARTALEAAPQRRETIKTLRKEIARLSREVSRGNKAIDDFHKKLDKERERAESIRETAKMLSRENLSLHRENRILGETAARVRTVTDESYWRRLALEGAQFTNKKLTARIAKLRAAGATLTKLPFDEAAHLRNVLRRSRRQKTTIRRLHRENVGLRRAVKVARAGREAAEARLARLRTARKAWSEKLSGMDVDLRRVLRRSRRQKTAIKSLAGKNARLHRAIRGMRRRIESLEAQLDKLRAAGSVLSKKLYGRKSEQQDKPRSERARGQQPGAPGHGRTQRPGLEERCEEINPPPDACVCAGCGQPLCAERSRGIQPRRDRGQGLQARDQPSTLAPDLRLRILAGGSVGAPGAAAVRPDALRDQLLGAFPVRTLRLLPARAPRRRVVLQPWTGGLAGNAGQQPQALRGAVRDAARGDSRAPEHHGAAPCRRDLLARAGTSR